MGRLFNLLTVLEETNDDKGQDIAKALKDMVKHPAFYIVIGALVLLIIVVYLLRRIIKPRSGEVKVVVRSGQIHKLIDEKSPKYFMVPFKDGLGAVITLNEKEFGSDKLFINNGPDALYQINYTLKYKVSDVEKFFKHRDNFQNIIVKQINDSLRDYADKGHVLEIIQDYREHDKDLLKLLNGITNSYGVEATVFKINYIQPLGKK